MKKNKYFGTDGIRSKAGQFPLDKESIAKITVAAARVLKKESSSRKIVIGRDTRESGSWISGVISAMLAGEGLEVHNAGVIPTPGISHLVQKDGYLSGIVVSASHNPYEDNGIKFFGHDGTKLRDEVEARIEDEIHCISAIDLPGTCEEMKIDISLAENYEKFLLSSWGIHTDLKNLKIGLDLGHGATYKTASEVYSKLNARLYVFNNAPDGRNINRLCGSLHPDLLSTKIRELKLDLGIAYDGDGDRVIFVDSKGNIVDGDYLLSIAALYLKKSNQLKNNTLVTTVMANLGLMKAMEANKINVEVTSVGDRFVHEAMVSTGSNIGGEQSGHLIFKDFLPTGDGILSSLQVLKIIINENKPLHELTKVMFKYPQVLINTKVKARIPIESLKQTCKIIDDASKVLSRDGRVLVRYSGTEPLLRVMIEGEDESIIRKMAKNISDIAKNEIEAAV